MLSFFAYHGTTPGEPLIGGKDPVSNQPLPCLWVSNSYFLAAQFQDGEVRKLTITLNTPLVITEDDRHLFWRGASHASIVRTVLSFCKSGQVTHDAVIFLNTTDGMESGDVAAILPTTDDPLLSKRVTEIGKRFYCDEKDDWVSESSFIDPSHSYEIPLPWLSTL